jgi:tetratricopeptide (TPR) repeat protein
MTGAAKLALQASSLQQAALDCMAAVEKDPKNVEAREAAAEAHIRLVVTGASKDQRKLIDRAIELDPYSPQAYLLGALNRHRAGALSEALTYYDHACWLAPSNPEIRYHRGYALLEAARRPDIAEDDATELAEGAAADFEAVLARAPDHTAAALGAIEAAIQGKVTKLRESLKRVFGRVAPREDLVRPITVLLYQVIFAFRVGKAKSVDQKNQKTMAELAEIARPWIAAFPGDADLAGVLVAAQAKCETPEGLCEKIADYARGIPDVRILRLLMRERLAEVPDARRRLELFESAMKRISALDGITHDYLQLKHLTAKRAAAEGDLSAAQATWIECEELDPDNPSVVMNLLHLATSRGDKQEIKRLTTKLEDLWSLYAQVSPRPDLVLMRAHARHEAHVTTELDQIEEELRADKQPKVKKVEALLERWLVGQALARLAVDDDAREELTPAALRGLLSFDKPTEDEVDVACEVIGLPMSDASLPTAYAYLDLAKDAPDDEIQRSFDAFRERMERTIEAIDGEGGDPTPFRALLKRAKEETKPLLSPVQRAAYDRVTAPVEIAEVCRRQCDTWRRLVRVAVTATSTKAEAHGRIADKLVEVPRAMMEPYLETAMEDARWLEVKLLQVRYIDVIRRGWDLLGADKIQQALALCQKELGGAADMFAAQELFASLTLRDASADLWSSVEAIRRAARRAVEVAHWSDGMGNIKRMRELATCPEVALAQRAAAGRALSLSENRMGEAARFLWAAYPGKRNAAYPSTSYRRPMVEPLSDLAPTGRGFYAFAVARVLRTACIEWYNAQSPQDYYDLMNLKSAARAVGASAHRWAVYAMDALSSETLPPEMLQNIADSLQGLMNALSRDASALS